MDDRKKDEQIQNMRKHIIDSESIGITLTDWTIDLSRWLELKEGKLPELQESCIKRQQMGALMPMDWHRVGWRSDAAICDVVPQGSKDGPESKASKANSF